MALVGATAIAVGLTGSDVSTDDGHTWQLFDQTDRRQLQKFELLGRWGKRHCRRTDAMRRAHSLGTVIAYEALHAHPTWK
jgi:hypothetical protein